MATPVAQLPDNTIIYRAIRNKSWIAGARISPASFMLRPNDEGYLSVLTAANCSANYCAAILRTCFGELILSLAAIRQLGLDVVPKPLPNMPDHAGIVNIPDHAGATLLQAEKIAGRLAKQSQIRLRPK